MPTRKNNRRKVASEDPSVASASPPGESKEFGPNGEEDASNRNPFQKRFEFVNRPENENLTIDKIVEEYEIAYTPGGTKDYHRETSTGKIIPENKEDLVLFLTEETPIKQLLDVEKLKEQFDFQNKLDQARTKAKTPEAAEKAMLKVAKGMEKYADACFENLINQTFLYLHNDRTVEYYGPLPGYQEGFQDIGSFKALIVGEWKPIPSKEGDFSLIEEILDRLGDEGKIRFDMWLKRSKDSLYNRKICTQLALALVGKKSVGKTLVLDTIVTPILGGRWPADPIPASTNKTDFNDSLAKAENWKVDDQVLTSKTAIQAFHGFIKKVGPSLSGVANRLVALEEFGAAEPVG
jgi:hypothetical protein